MKSYVINLDRAGERRSHMTDQFTRLALNYIRIPAVDGSALSEADYEKFAEIYGPQVKRGWSRGYMSCFLSHLAAWQTIADSSDDHAAVFEDDVHGDYVSCKPESLAL